MVNVLFWSLNQNNKKKTFIKTLDTDMSRLLYTKKKESYYSTRTNMLGLRIFSLFLRYPSMLSSISFELDSVTPVIF